MMQIVINMKGKQISSTTIENAGVTNCQQPNLCVYNYENWITGERDVIRGSVFHNREEGANKLAITVLSDIEEGQLE